LPQARGLGLFIGSIFPPPFPGHLQVNASALTDFTDG
jgi:hypothetical protein